MASVVLNNSQFPVTNANILVCDGILSGGDGLQLPDGGLTANGTIIGQEVQARWVVSDGARLNSTLGTNGGGAFRVMSGGVGTTTTDNVYYTNAEQTNYEAPAWNATYNYAGVHNYVLVVYGTNTAAVGDYPNNIFYALDTAPTPPVVGVPPTLTPAPYPAGGGVPSAGWLLAKDSVASGGASVVADNGFAPLHDCILSGYEPALYRFFGGGGESIGLSVPRGVSIQESSIVASTNTNNGALLDVAGVAKADGFYIHNTDQALSPASSANALFIPASPNGFVLGNNYTWTAPVAPATAWHWVGAAGTAGSMTLSGPATSMAFDPNCMVMLTPVFVGASACGSIGLSNKATTSITIDSRDAAGAVEAGDVRSIEWIVFNPNWTT